MTIIRQKGEDWHTFHDRVLKSSYWQKKRQKVLRLFNFACALNLDLGDYCSGPIDVHHRSYARLGREEISDLIPLCRYHHKMFHDDVSKEKKPVKQSTRKKGKFNLWF